MANRDVDAYIDLLLKTSRGFSQIWQQFWKRGMVLNGKRDDGQ